MTFGSYYQPNYGYNYQPQQTIPDYRIQMPQQTVSQPVSNGNGFVWVDSIEEANAYFVAPNNAVQLWDKNSPCVYLKSADSAGKPSMQIFDLVERKSQPVVNAKQEVEYITRSEFDSLVERVEALQSKSKPKAKLNKDEGDTENG